MNRIERIFAILIHLQTKKIVRASELAERFNISLRTVYRDMNALEEAGVPIGSEAGKGYYIVEGYHLPPVMFSSKEAIAMLIGEKLVNNIADEETKRNYAEAMFKIRSVLPGSEKRFLETLSPNIEILHFKTQQDNTDIQYQLSTIQTAIVEERMIKIDYYSHYKSEIVEGRFVEPIGLCFYSFTWHLIGFCKLRKDYRDFRLDRIKKISLTDRMYEPLKRKSIKEYLLTLTNNRNLIQIIIYCKDEFLKEISGVMQYYGYVGREKVSETETALFFMNDSIEYVARWLLTCGKNISIKEPVELKNKITELVEELNKHYN